MPDRYDLMRDRASVFRPTASWVSVAISLAVLWFGFQIVFSMAFSLWSAADPATYDPLALDEFFYGSTPSAVRWTLATYGLYILLLVFILRMIHSIRLRALIGPFSLATRQFLRVSLYISPLYVLLVLPALAWPTVYQNMPFGVWLAILPTVLPFLFIQIGAEELIFRGYLQSHIAALTRNPVIWMLVPSFLFGMAHYDPTAPAYSAWAYVFWATGLGLVCADITARSGTLGPALAVHFINNIGALLILASDEWLFGASLYIFPTNGEPWEPWILFETLYLFTVWLAARLALRR